MLALIVDAIIVLVMVEAVGLTAFHAATGRGVSPGKLLPNLGAGLSLMLALRFAVTSGIVFPVLACLGGALVFHLLDLLLRWGGR